MCLVGPLLNPARRLERLDGATRPTGAAGGSAVSGDAIKNDHRAAPAEGQYLALVFDQRVGLMSALLRERARSQSRVVPGSIDPGSRVPLRRRVPQDSNGVARSIRPAGCLRGVVWLRSASDAYTTAPVDSRPAPRNLDRRIRA